MPWEVCMQNEFFYFIVFRIEENILGWKVSRRKCKDFSYHPHSEVVIEIVWLQWGGFSVCIWRMNFHFVFRLIKYSTRGSHRRHHILHRITESNWSLHMIRMYTSGWIAATGNLPHVWLKGDGHPSCPLPRPKNVHPPAGEGRKAGQRGQGGRALSKRVFAVNCHVGHIGGFTKGKLKSSK